MSACERNRNTSFGTRPSGINPGCQITQSSRANNTGHRVHLEIAKFLISCKVCSLTLHRFNKCKVKARNIGKCVQLLIHIGILKLFTVNRRTELYSDSWTGYIKIALDFLVYYFAN